jgi:ribonucleoside-triphosphate reductase
VAKVIFPTTNTHITIMNKGKEFLSELVHYRSYAKYIPSESRRETKEETINRSVQMHIEKYPKFTDEIVRAFDMMKQGKIVSSMRAMQFGGEAMLKRHNRGYNCFKKDTNFITKDGVKSFEDFSDGDETVVLTDQGRWKKGIVKMHGIQALYKVSIKRGGASHTVICTKDHTWIKYNNERTTNLNTGDRLKQGPNIFCEFDYDSAPIEERLYWCYGFVFGDGTICKNKKGEYSKSLVRLCDHDREYAYRFEELSFKTSKPLSCGGDIFAYTGSYLKTPPDPEIDSPSLIRAFVAGYLAADGEKNGNNRLGEGSNIKSHYRSIQSSEVDHINFIRKCFPIAGVYIISEKDLTNQVTNFGTRPYTILFRCNTSPGNNTASMFKVEEMEYYEEDEVWCLDVEEDHSFVLPFGLSTGNCSATAIGSFRDFADLFFMSMSGAGVGFSVKRKHIASLPVIKEGIVEPPFIIEDSAEGWCDSLIAILENPDKQFDYTHIRKMGEPLSTGGTASGPKALIKMHANVRQILRKALHRKLTAFECHRICCLIADCVVVGGVRRGALISVFDPDDTELLHCKSGAWGEKYPELARANNSASVLKSDPEFKEKASAIIQACFDGGQAEPGLSLTNDDDYIWNPCHEISLRLKGLCNLSEVNAAKCFTQEEWMKAVEAATIIGTLQASYTDFKYVHPDWKKNAEEEALLGVSITGQAENQSILTDENLMMGAEQAVNTNKEWAAKLGINAAKRITTCKPSGSASSWLGTTAGIHAGHETRYLRRVRMEAESKLGKALSRKFSSFVVQDPFKESDIIMQVPIRMYDTTLLRSQESSLQCLERMKRLYHNWIVPGHIDGPNTHNISLTINYHEHEKDSIKEWMINNKDSYYGISLTPYDGGDYKYLPYSQPPHPEVFDILEKTFNTLAVDFDFSKIKETHDNTDFKGESACSGGACVLDL